MSLRVHQPQILFFASGPPAASLTVLDRLETRFADHRVDLVVSEQLLHELTPDRHSRVVYVLGRGRERWRFLRRARGAPYWMIAILLGGNPGYLSTKVAALALGFGRTIIGYNEYGDAFAFDRRHARIISAHVSRRLGAPGGFVSAPGQFIVRAGYALLEPVGLVWMSLCLAWGRLRAVALSAGRGSQPGT